MGDYVYDYGDASDSAHVKAIFYPPTTTMLPYPKVPEMTSERSQGPTRATATSADNESSFSLLDLFPAPDDDASSDADFGAASLELWLTPFPLRVIVTVLVPVGILINLSSLCHCRRISSAFLSLCFYLVALAQVGLLLALMVNIGIPTFSERFAAIWLPRLSAYCRAASVCLSALTNYTLLLMTAERLASAQNYLQRLGCCLHLLFFSLEIVVMVAVGAYAVPWFTSICTGRKEYWLLDKQTFASLYSRLWILLGTKLISFLMSLVIVLCTIAKMASVNRSLKHMVPEQESRQTNAVKWMVAFWTLVSIPTMVLAALEVGKAFELITVDENKVLQADHYYEYSSVGRISVVCIPCAVVGNAAFAALSMMLKFTC